MGGKVEHPIEVFQTVGAWFDAGKRDVELAMRRSLEKHGLPTIDPVRGATTLAEEVGEVAEQALDATRKDVLHLTKRAALNNMCNELAQVAGYAMLLLQSMKGEIYKLDRETKA